MPMTDCSVRTASPIWPRRRWTMERSSSAFTSSAAVLSRSSAAASTPRRSSRCKASRPRRIRGWGAVAMKQASGDGCRLSCSYPLWCPLRGGLFRALLDGRGRTEVICRSGGRNCVAGHWHASRLARGGPLQFNRRCHPGTCAGTARSRRFRAPHRNKSVNPPRSSSRADWALFRCSAVADPRNCARGGGTHGREPARGCDRLRTRFPPCEARRGRREIRSGGLQTRRVTAASRRVSGRSARLVLRRRHPVAAVHRIVAHGQARNVTIVPEIDMPGHATAAIVAYPQLGATNEPPQAVPADWGIYPNLFNVEESTFAFLEDVLAEVMGLFPGEYIHVGGDEAVKDQWKASARVQARMRELGVANEEALQGYFTHRMGEYLRAHDRRLVGWDEILEGGVPADATVMSWRGVQGAIAAAAAGHDAVLSPDPTLYLDSRQGRSPSEPPGLGTVETLADVYHFDPLPGPLAGDGRHVLGLQANLWTEHVRTEERAAYMTWPRAAALAEIGWSPPARLDWPDFLARLPAEFRRLSGLGVHYSDDALAPPHTVGPHERHMSQDLKTCTDKLVLSLEDDAPMEGARAVFLIDIMNPCWILPAADLSHGSTLTAAVGQVPFNFQIGKDIEAIKLNAPNTPAGELEVRLDGCQGEPVAVLPLAPAADNDAVTTLPAVPLSSAAGPHDLCFRFTQRTPDPLWALDWVQLLP